MKRFNLSDWSLDHKSLVWYFMIVFTLFGVFSYINLGREEDPSFTIKTMVVQAYWPGASVTEMTRQVTDRIEKKLQELPNLDFTRNLTRPGVTTVFVNLRNDTKAAEVDGTWVRVRNLVSDIRAEMPDGVVGPFFNDDFGDVFGNIYALTADGFTPRQLRDYAEAIRTRILSVENVGKVDIVGAEDEVIYLEFSPRQLAAYGVDEKAVLTTLAEQNAVNPSGTIETGSERVSVRVSGEFRSEKSIEAVNLRVNGRFFRLSDVAKISRGYADPPTELFRYNGEPAIGIAIGMRAGANLLKFGDALRAEMAKVEAELPVGIAVHQVADQPKLVEKAVSGFTQALFEAVAIVLLVSFLSLGLRAGVVVALSIPLVLAITFMVMEASAISLQRVSLGALIIALGLLVDDAMIAVEMMVARLEKGDSLRKAATAVYTSTAFPMLTGTLVTVAGFIPVGLNSSMAGEFTFTMFVVIAVSLLVSWIVAVVFTPLIGVTVLPAKLKHQKAEKTRFTRGFERLLVIGLRNRFIVIALTLLAFGASLYGLTRVQQQFFPDSDRSELIVDFTLPQNAAIEETARVISRFETDMLAGKDGVDHWSSYIGRGAVRFLLTFDQEPSAPYLGQIVVVTRDEETRNHLRAEFSDYLRRAFPGVDSFVRLLEIGPPVGRPVAYRLSGPDIESVRETSGRLAAIVAANPHVDNVVADWGEPGRVVKVDVMQDKARLLGVSSQDISNALYSIIGGATVTKIRDDIYQIDVIGRAVPEERNSIETLKNLQLATQTGSSVPLAAVANLHYELEQPVVWSRNRLPTVTIRAARADATQADTIVAQLRPDIDAFAATLPAGYKVETAGSAEESQKAMAPIVDVVPLMAFIMLTVLMIQLQSFSRLVLVVAVAPLALIGVVAALLPTGAPLGFVAILGVLALIGILIRNSVILVDQIERLRADGMPAWNAVVEATGHRFRPIVLTALAASLGLIPIANEVFWQPMAFAMMGGIIVGTALTLIFLPALYVTWFRIREERADEPTPAAPVET
ncbi:Cobalt-zinc-cadmium resistance protein CzcA [Pleomorphomonas sp. T1.2MG-36]|uniref:efflux RND transporter permease subunit n=1 Tax=Pleomorphomonas sp. T1.2MG-36 TaxID=3041167 RepID=UPI002477AD43|nr:efflux RND transporter permease subunit [Pleomorphomonas sp. T1.2MG-36]CAI9413341.1 Cobalt-zinc-cadmium resistance protein CzcA [Pleomorphomonas sp. T1.2MG-36]